MYRISYLSNLTQYENLANPLAMAMFLREHVARKSGGIKANILLNDLGLTCAYVSLQIFPHTSPRSVPNSQIGGWWERRK